MVYDDKNDGGDKEEDDDEMAKINWVPTCWEGLKSTLMTDNCSSISTKRFVWGSLE